MVAGATPASSLSKPLPADDRPQTPIPPATAIERLLGMRIRASFGTAEALERASGMTASEVKAAVLFAEMQAKAENEDKRPSRRRPSSARRCDSAVFEMTSMRDESSPASGPRPSTPALPSPTMIERTLGMRVRIPIVGTAAATEEALGVDAHAIKASVLAAEAQARAQRRGGRALWDDD